MKIVFSPAISAKAWAIGEALVPAGFSVEILAKEPERRVDQLKDADFLMGFARAQPLKADDYPHLRKVKLIQLLSAGYDGIDIGLLRKSGIPLANNGGANSYAVSARNHADARSLSSTAGARPPRARGPVEIK